MNKKDLINNIIESNKWVKNDIAMGRVQCSKLIRTNSEPELMVVITSNLLKKPILSNIEQILVVKDELILFYDGQFSTELDIKEYDKYKENFSKEEWEILFEQDSSDNLLKNGYILKGEGYYLEIHETMEKFMRRGVDKKESDEVEKEFNLKQFKR